MQVLDSATVKKLELVTEGLQAWIGKDLAENVSKENALVIANYILALKTEINLSDSYRKNTIKLLIAVSKFHKNKAFKELTREDNLLYLDAGRKPEASDPLHKWIGTYNLRRMNLIRFFKWLHSPEVDYKKRQVPDVMSQIPMLKRKEQSIYKPSDMWTKEDDLLFLKYCPSKRDRAYHIASRDTSCRPHELLNLRIKDLMFKMAGTYQYAEILVNGKTGTRHIPIVDAIPYLKEWLNEHPQRGNPKAYLFPSRCHQNFLRRMSDVGINHVYREYKRSFFPRLLKDPNVPPEDKIKIEELFLKPWNPYLRRHSALTEKSIVLKDHVLKQHAGWSQRSIMHLKYIHYFGNESSESLLEAYGIMPKADSFNALKPKQCPECSEPNAVDAQFCSKCRFILSRQKYDAVLAEQAQKDMEHEQLLKDVAEIKKKQALKDAVTGPPPA